MVRRRRRRTRARRRGHARASDRAAAARRPGNGPQRVQAGFQRARRGRAGRLLRSPWPGPQRPPLTRRVEPRYVGRRRRAILRCARHRATDRARQLVRRHGRDALRGAASEPSVQARPVVDRRAHRRERDRGDVRTLGRRGRRRDRTGVLGDPTDANRDAYLAKCGPLYTQSPGNLFDTKRAIRNNDVTTHFIRTEKRSMDLRPGLARIACPTLALAGGLDPVCPPACAHEIAAAIDPALVRLELFETCGHGVFRRPRARLQDAVGLRRIAARDGAASANPEPRKSLIAAPRPTRESANKAPAIDEESQIGDGKNSSERWQREPFRRADRRRRHLRHRRRVSPDAAVSGHQLRRAGERRRASAARGSPTTIPASAPTATSTPSATASSRGPARRSPRARGDPRATWAR